MKFNLKNLKCVFVNLLQKKVIKNIDQLIPYLILLAILLTISILQPGVFSMNWIGVKTDTMMPLVFASIAQTFVMMIGGMDISVGGVICFTNSFAAIMMRNSTGSILSVSLEVLMFGLLAGAFNGLIIVKLRLQSFIATLATWSIWGGIALCILPTDGGNVPQSFVNMLLSKPAGIPFSVILIILLVLFGIYFRTTKFGISIIAVGGNEKGAYYGGINVNAIKIWVYALSGFFAAMAGLYLTAQVASGSPTAGNNFIMLSFAAAVIGGVSVASGNGSFAGAIVGAFIMELLTDLLVFLGVSTYYTALVQGILLILAVGINSLITQVKRNNSMGAKV